MLKNLYNGFITALERILEHGSLAIDRRTVFSVHSMLISELVGEGDKGVLRTRPVRITGTAYVPPADKHEIEASFENILAEQHAYANPLERAIFLHGNMAWLQPFIDGNKRTSRLLESIVLMNSDIIPVYSSKDEDLLSYHNGLDWSAFMRPAIIPFIPTTSWIGRSEGSTALRPRQKQSSIWERNKITL